MRLTPTELDRLTIFTAAELARRRRAKGWKLNHPEALALIADEMHEAARGGASYEQVLEVGRATLSAEEVLDGVPELIGTLKLECLFGDGMRVLHVDQPIRPAGSAARSASEGESAAGSDAADSAGR
jgi:urease subunit gamma/beta